MDLTSRCALRVASILWRPGHSGFAYTVVCKATFQLQPDLSPLATQQQLVTVTDVPSGSGGEIRFATDLLPFKKKPEVLLVGHAFAPGGRAVSSLVARLVVGEIDKALQVVGDRRFGPDGNVGVPSRFLRVPLVWSRASGGPNTWNPAGIDLGTSASQFGPAPNLLPPTFTMTSISDVAPPVGFGPIGPLWPSRVACLGRHAANWAPDRWHEQPLPADLDLAYFNAAPPDQQRASPFGEEHLYLENLHPLFERLSTRLAPVTPAVTVDHGSGPQPLQMRCDTLILDTDRGIAMLLWRGHVLLDRADRDGLVVVTGPASPPSSASSWSSETAQIDSTLAPGLLPVLSSPLPFGLAPAFGSSSASSAAPPPAAQGAGAHRSRSPVASSTAGLPSRVMTPPVRGGVETTLTLGFLNDQEVLPFRRSQIWEEQQPPGPGDQSGEALHLTPREILDDDDPVTPRRSNVEPLAPYDLPAPPPAPDVQDLGRLLSQEREAPARPAMLGVVLSPPDEGTHAKPAQQSPPGVAGKEQGDSSEAEPEIAFEEHPPAICGAIAARLACDDGCSTDDILCAAQLDRARWQRVHDHWQSRIRDEAARGRTTALASYDSAYVGALESQRGPITVDLYSQLAEAAERGVVDVALKERGLPPGAWPHIHRLWIQRTVKDLGLARCVRAAITAVRAAW